MATIKKDMTVGLQTSKDEDVEEVFLAKDTEVQIVKEWAHFYLVKDGEGHFYNLPKDAVAP